MGVAVGVSVGLREASVPVAGIDSGSAGAFAERREVGHVHERVTPWAFETVRLPVRSDNVAQISARLSWY